MARNSEWTKCTEETPIFQCQETERDNDEEYGFFMYVPSEEEGGITAKSGRAYESVPGWLDEELRETYLLTLVKTHSGMAMAYKLEKQSQGERHSGRNLR